MQSSNSNIHLSFDALKVVKYAKMYEKLLEKCTFLESCVKIKKVAQNQESCSKSKTLLKHCRAESV